MLSRMDGSWSGGTILFAIKKSVLKIRGKNVSLVVISESIAFLCTFSKFNLKDLILHYLNPVRRSVAIMLSRIVL